MKMNTILCEAIEVSTDNGICPGVAKVKKGEQFVLDGRTPVGEGMCTNALCALSNPAFVMMSTEDKPGGKNGSIERFCPHGAVKYRMSRTDLVKSKPFNQIAR